MRSSSGSWWGRLGCVSRAGVIALGVVLLLVVVSSERLIAIVAMGAIVYLVLKRLGSRSRERSDGSEASSSQSSPNLSRTERPSRHATDAYYKEMTRMQEAVSNRHYAKAAEFARESLGHIPRWVNETKSEYGSFDIRSIPALEQGGTILALVGDNDALSTMKNIVSAVSELEPWAEQVDGHLHDQRLFRAIEEAVLENSGCLQTEMKNLVGEPDGRRIATLISYLEKAGKIVRVKDGRTYRLHPPGARETPAPAPQRVVQSHRRDRKPPRLREIDVAALDYVALPRSPTKWEEARGDKDGAKPPKAEDYFEVVHADWQIDRIEKIPKAERPDTAFRQLHPTDSGLFMIDDLGKAEDFDSYAASALRYDRSGRLVATGGMEHDIYRIGVHPLGRGLIAMSRDCIAHAYDDEFELILETDLRQAPEMSALSKRFDVPEEKLRNHIRCVALSRAADRYLFTLVDEAWCVDIDGKGLWGAKLPVKEGWTQVASPSANSWTSAEVHRALSFMGLSLPVTSEETKQRYRELAKRWHPDLHPEDPQAQERMKELNASAEVVTGIEAADLPRYSGAMFGQDMNRMEFEVGGVSVSVSIGMQMPEIYAADWIYAASFAAANDSAYLAGYSGRVVLVDENGTGVRTYDIGSVPRRIVDTGDYLYILTDTRLYVLRDSALYALIDTHDAGDLVVAQSGFGLLEKKRLRWFWEDGTHLGGIVTKNPIRRVYHQGEKDLVVETRQRKAVIRGVPGWWE